MSQAYTHSPAIRERQRWPFVTRMGGSVCYMGYGFLSVALSQRQQHLANANDIERECSQKGRAKIVQGLGTSTRSNLEREEGSPGVGPLTITAPKLSAVGFLAKYSLATY